MFRRTVADDHAERSSKGERIDQLEREVNQTHARLHFLAVGAHQRLDSYRRVRLGR